MLLPLIPTFFVLLSFTTTPQKGVKPRLYISLTHSLLHTFLLTISLASPMCVRGESLLSATIGRREYILNHASHRPLLIYVLILSLVLLDCCVGMEFTMSEKRRLELKYVCKHKDKKQPANYIKGIQPK